VHVTAASLHTLCSYTHKHTEHYTFLKAVIARCVSRCTVSCGRGRWLRSM